MKFNGDSGVDGHVCGTDQRSGQDDPPLSPINNGCQSVLLQAKDSRNQSAYLHLYAGLGSQIQDKPHSIGKYQETWVIPRSPAPIRAEEPLEEFNNGSQP